MSDLQSRIAALTSAKRILFENSLRGRARQEGLEPIRPRDPSQRPPLSFAQQRLWFLDQWEPGSVAYNLSTLLRIEGALDTTALERSLTEISRRHETLRTTFEYESDAPVQVIHPPAPVELLRLNVTEQEVLSVAKEDAARPFDLITGPLFRATLLQIHPRRHVLLLATHHILSDLWSMGLLSKELFTLYEAFARDQSSPLAELPIQYADFAVWQRHSLERDRLTKQLRYWREQLHNLPVLELPTDRPRPRVQTFTGAIHRIDVPARVVDGLKSLSRDEGTTLFVTLLAAFQTLLNRYTGQDEIVVGSPIAGRTRIEVEPLIGFFVNMLVLRTDASGNPTFREFLRRVEKVALEAYDCQDIPFERLVAELQPRRDASRNPLFQVAFSLQNVTPPSLSLSGLTVKAVSSDEATIRFDLEVHLRETEGGLKALFVYNTSLFEGSTIARMSQHFQTILEGIVVGADERLSHLPLLSSEERRQIVFEWNQTGTTYARDASIHSLFEVQAAATPNELAVAFGKKRLTYRQLHEQSDRLARHLRSLGVERGTRVGICVERSVEMIVGLLGILKAGGAYVPLDSACPRGRLAFILEDANVEVLLTQPALLRTLPETDRRVVCLDEIRFSDENLEPLKPICAADVAYVIYTSGSTGRPKGVSVPHRAVVRLVHGTNYVRLGPGDRIAQASNASFDAATFEIWGALLNGASLIGVSKNDLLSPTELARVIRSEKVTTLFVTTALFNQIVADVPTAFQPLRYLLVGGETCDRKWMRRVLERGAPQHFLHVYGPTEATTFTTSHRVVSIGKDATTVPIGRPISNTRVYIVDRYAQPVPIGAIGEIYIGGDGLASEYLNRPDLTAGKFIPDPFSADPSARLYKTGDFARYLTDGSIEFVGRVDQQVKIRGFRVELQEIESNLSQHPGVAKCVVVKRGVDVATRLIAYVVPDNAADISGGRLREFLRQKVPEYMVPSAFVLMNSLPLMLNGKIDHAALPEPKAGWLESDALPRPRTPTEKTLADMWKALLRVRRVNVDDNFFDLGGHSLLAVQLASRIEKRFRKSLPVAVLFQAPTIEQLARLLDTQEWPESWSRLIHIQPHGSKTPFFWVHGESSNAALPVYLGPDQPLYGVEHQAHDGNPALYREVGTIAKHYIDEIREVHPRGPYLLGGFSFGAVVAYEMAGRLKKEGHEVDLLFMLDPTGKASDKTEKEKPLPLISRAYRTLNRLQWTTCAAMGRLLPPPLRSPYILDIYRKALRSYVPKPYTGRVVIFKTGGPYAAPFNWLELIQGDLELHESTGDHMDLRKEPLIGRWAQRLKESLDRASGVLYGRS